MNYLLQTDRLRLIPFDLEDVQLFHKINTHPFVRQYLWDDEQISLETSEEIIRQNHDYFTNSGFGLWKIHLAKSDQIIGYVGLWYFFEESQPQLIYALLPDFTKNGYAIEAGKAIVDYAFNQLRFNYLTAATDEPHKDSQTVALKIGMKLVDQRIENGKPTLFYRIDKQRE